jgi:hypothetical protein
MKGESWRSLKENQWKLVWIIEDFEKETAQRMRVMRDE